jgi:hypothetical protein
MRIEVQLFTCQFLKLNGVKWLRPFSGFFAIGYCYDFLTTKNQDKFFNSAQLFLSLLIILHHHLHQISNPFPRLSQFEVLMLSTNTAHNRNPKIVNIFLQQIRELEISMVRKTQERYFYLQKFL